MNYPAALFSSAVLLGSLLLAALLLGLAVWRVRWRTVTDSALNAWLGATVLVMVLWLLKGGFLPGLAFHLLGAVELTLMMGPWLAMLAMAVVVLAQTAVGNGDWLSAGLNWLVMGALPIGLAAGVLAAAWRWLPANVFVYIFVNGFLAGGASFFFTGLAGVSVLALAHAYPAEVLYFDELPYYFLMSWSEAFLTGFVTAILVVYFPQWMATFDDSRYLKS
jgi:uncharacterized membrane protein